MKNILTLILLALLGMYCSAQVCNPLDPSFGIGGKSIGFTTGPNAQVNSQTIITQPDGKIIQVGNLYNYNGYPSVIIALRYNANGSLDGTFGTNGIAFSSFYQNHSYVSNAVLQTDGKIVVVGNFNNNQGDDLILVRFKNNGSLDSSFGINGQLVTAIGASSDDARSLALQPDGKIVVAGVSTDTTSLCQIQSYFPQAVVVRFNSNGSIDSSFGQKGKVFSGTGNYKDFANNVAAQPDGKILVAGTAFYDCSCVAGYYGGLEWYCQKSFFLLQRFNADVSPDITFGKNGKATDSLLLNEPSEMILQSDGKIVVTAGVQNGFVVERYNIDGSPDNSFGTAGKIFTKIANDGDYLVLNSAAIQPDGKIVLVGGLNNNATANFVVVRYNSDGSLDSQFNTNGIAVFHIGPPDSYDIATGVALQDNKIIAGGQFYDGQTNNIVIVRLNELSLQPLGSIITAGGPVSFCDGGSVKLSTAVSGGVQWFNNNSAISGATGSDYIAVASGSYSVIVNNAGICGLSDTVRVTELNNPLPEINWNDELTFCDGDSVILSTSNTASLQWYKNGNSINGQTGTAYVANSSGTYSVVATNSSGCIGSSSPVVVTAKSNVTPTVSWNGALSFCEGDSVILSTTDSVNLQWYKNGNPISGATGSTYTVTSSGSYTESNGCGVSAPVIVAVNSNPPKPPINWNGTQFSTDSGYVNYQWWLNGVAIAGATNNIYVPGSANGLFKVQVTDASNCSNVSDTFNKVVTGVADITLGDTRLRYYPNPTSTLLYVEITQQTNKKWIAELYDQTGRLLQKQSLHQRSNEISVAGLAAGLYGLVIYNGKERTVRKLMVIK